ncbi:MAG: hypothetical protein RL660_1120 [Bacteroidota bacterium]|jgi:hypothetical protein
MAQKTKNIPTAVQAGYIKKMFPDSHLLVKHDKQLVWSNTICPSPIGDNYKIKLEYSTHSKPNVFVLSPKPLLLANGKTQLEHCYDQQKQRLCLYVPNSGEWTAQKLLTQTIIPWTYDWLYHYEIWLATGNWTGGGIHPLTDKLKLAS